MYCLSVSEKPDLLKISATEGSLEQLHKEVHQMSETLPTGSYKLEFYKKVPNQNALQHLHLACATALTRLHPERDFFQGSI